MKHRSRRILKGIQRLLLYSGHVTLSDGLKDSENHCGFERVDKNDRINLIVSLFHDTDNDDYIAGKPNFLAFRRL